LYVFPLLKSTSKGWRIRNTNTIIKNAM
jgi:hypothetical protein